MVEVLDVENLEIDPLGPTIAPTTQRFGNLAGQSGCADLAQFFGFTPNRGGPLVKLADVCTAAHHKRCRENH
jgi:hypothetical protein